MPRARWQKPYISSTGGKAVPKADPHDMWLGESAAALLAGDPLLARALGVLAATPQSAEEAAERLLYEELLASSSFEVGTWGRAPFASAAERALRLQRVAVGGDELDWDAVAGAG